MCFPQKREENNNETAKQTPDHINKDNTNPRPYIQQQSQLECAYIKVQYLYNN